MQAVSLVKNLFIKTVHQASMSAIMSAMEKLELRRGYGIVGDANANNKSPRQVLVVNSTDLDDLAISPGELRENIVLEGVESYALKPGTKLVFPSGGCIRLTFYCEPCKRVRVAHLVDSLRNMEQKRGILGVVIHNGTVSIGDRVKVYPNCFPALSEIPYERYLDFLSKVPLAKVVTYRQILQGIGVDKSYFRVLPLYIKKTPPNYPVHRILDSQGKITAYVPQQKQLLEAEGIEVIIDRTSHKSNSLTGDRYSVCLEQYAWNNSSLF